MKNFLKLISIFLIALFVVGCSKAETKTYVYEASGFQSEVVFTYSKEKISKRVSTTTLTFKDLNMTREQIESVTKDLSEKYNSLDGVEHKLEFSDEKVVETMTVDYEKVNVEQAKGLSGLEFVEKSNITEAENILKENGYSEKK